MAGESLQQHAPRARLFDLGLGGVLVFQFNPAVLKEKLAPKYANLEILGLPHEPQQYVGTGNLEWSFMLEFDALQPGIERDAQAPRRFLESQCYPRRSAQDVAQATAARSLFFWPQLAACVGTIRGLDISHERFSREGGSTYYSASVTFEEDLSQRVYAEDVLEFGTMRGG